MYNYFVILIGAFLALSGCTKKEDRTYFLQHPQALRKAIAECRQNDLPTKHCDMVADAAQAFSAMIDEQQADPEKFGEKIMQLELAYSDAEIEVKKAQDNVQHLSASRANQAQIQEANEQLQAAQRAYHEKQDAVKNALAVVGLSSPE